MLQKNTINHIYFISIPFYLFLYTIQKMISLLLQPDTDPLGMKNVLLL